MATQSQKRAASERARATLFERIHLCSLSDGESDIAHHTETDQDKKMASVASKVRLPPQSLDPQIARKSAIAPEIDCSSPELDTHLFRNFHRNALMLTQFLRAEPLRASGYLKIATWSPDEPSNHELNQATTRSWTPTESLSLLPRSSTSPSSAPASATLVPRVPPTTLPDPLPVAAVDVTLSSLALSRVNYACRNLAHNLTH